MDAEIENDEMKLADLSVEQIKHIVVVRRDGNPETYTRPMDIGYFQTTWGSEDMALRDGVWNSMRSTTGYIAFVICLKD